MAHHVSQLMKVTIPASKIWAVLKDYSAMEKFAPTVKSSPIVGEQTSGVGAKRKVTLHYDGSSMIEEILAYQEGEGYKMDVSDLSAPFKSMQAEFRVKSINGDSSEIYMTVDFEVNKGPLGWLMGTFMMKPMMKGVLRKNASGLAYYAATGKVVGAELPSKSEMNAAVGQLS